MADNWYDPNRYNQYNAQPQYPWSGSPQPQYNGLAQPQYQPQPPHYDAHGWQTPTAAQYGFFPQPYGGGGNSANLAPGVDVGMILEGNPDQLPGAVAQIGAMNTKPPVVHSSHLKNTTTGLVLPWNSLLAEQRDIMVPCDKYGNTDPAAWQQTVVREESSSSQDAYWQARGMVVAQSMQYTEQFRDSSIDQGTIPSGVRQPAPGTMPFEQLSAPRDTFAPPVPPQAARQMPPTPSSEPPEAPAPAAPPEERDGATSVDALTALCDALGV